MMIFYVLKSDKFSVIFIFYIILLFLTIGNSVDAKATLFQQNQDVFERLQIDAPVLTDGSLLINETREYNINFFRSYFLADIVHGGLQVQEFNVYLNGEVLPEFEALPEYATNPAAEDPGAGYFVNQSSEAKTLSVFGRFGKTELRLSYRLEGAIQRVGSFAYLDYIFANGIRLSMEESVAQQRPSVRGRVGSFTLIFEQKPNEVFIARLFAANEGEPLSLDVFQSDEFMIRVEPLVIRPVRSLPIKMLFSEDAVPDLPLVARQAEVTVGSLEEEYQNWLEQIETEYQERQERAEKLGFWRPLGWVMLLLSLFTTIGRRFRKRKRKKQATQLDFNQKLSMADVRKLPLAVVKTLYNAMVLQPRNHVLRLTGLGILDLARAGHIRISTRILPKLLADPGYIEKLNMDAFRKLIPIQISQLIQLTEITIQPLDAKPDDSLRPWQKVLLGYIRSMSRGEATELKTLFPSKTKLNELEKTGAEGTKQAAELRKVLKSFKEKLRETYFNDLLNESALYEEKKIPIYINILAVLTGLYLMVLGSFLGFFLLLFVVPALFFAILNRYERTAEGLRYSNFIRDTFNEMRKSSRSENDIETAEDLFSVFMVLNWPGHYYEMYNKPHHPLFGKATGMSLNDINWITFNPQPDGKVDRILHFHNFILQDVCMRSLMQYPDFVAGNSKMLNNLVSKFNKRADIEKRN